MMTFAQTWERQERVRHQAMLQQLKAEFATKRKDFVRETPAVALPQASFSIPASTQTIPASTQTISRPKPNKQPRDRQELIQAVAVR
ncbi:MAG: hypothetical protein Kow00121_24660 [Elainellaceae cyanobacterium]